MCDHADVTNACRNLIIVKCVNFRHSVKLLCTMMFVSRILLVLFRLRMSSFLCSMSGMCVFVLCKMLSLCYIDTGCRRHFVTSFYLSVFNISSRLLCVLRQCVPLIRGLFCLWCVVF